MTTTTATIGNVPTRTKATGFCWCSWPNAVVGCPLVALDDNTELCVFLEFSQLLGLGAGGRT